MMILNFHVFCVFVLGLCLLVYSALATELELLTPKDKQILISGSSYDIKWPSRQSGTTNLTLMRMVSDSGVGGSILKISCSFIM